MKNMSIWSPAKTDLKWSPQFDPKKRKWRPAVQRTKAHNWRFADTDCTKKLNAIVGSAEAGWYVRPNTYSSGSVAESLGCVRYPYRTCLMCL